MGVFTVVNPPGFCAPISLVILILLLSITTKPPDGAAVLYCVVYASNTLVLIECLKLLAVPRAFANAGV